MRCDVEQGAVCPIGIVLLSSDPENTFLVLVSFSLTITESNT